MKTAVLSAALSLIVAGAAPAELGKYYVGYDNRATVASGPYADLPNPNAGRLTLLVAEEHVPVSGSHFHSVGVYTYTGPVDAPTILPTSTNNRLPEVTSGEPPIELVPGSGVFAGRYVSAPGANPYSDLRLRAVDSLFGSPAGSVEAYVLASVGERWNGSLAGAQLAFELLAISPGLHVADGSGTTILSAPGQTYSLGDGAGVDFRPVFWVDAAAAPGVYSATLRLIDTTDTFRASGEFTFDFEVLPEPATLLLLTPVLLLRRRRAHA